MILHTLTVDWTLTYSCAKEDHEQHVNVENTSKSGCLHGLI